jgi:hypothetical protein
MRFATMNYMSRHVEEGLRMDEHPLVRFADGPTGQRARLTGTGKDVWEVIAAVRDNDGDEAAEARAAWLAGRTRSAIRTPSNWRSNPRKSVD